MATKNPTKPSQSNPKVQQNPKSHPPNLVGKIIEKGFSSSPSSVRPPLPTVLPFPVARHRSHGGPNRAPPSAKEEEDAFDDDDQVPSSSSSFVNPITRKEKKGLDFSNWKDVLNVQNGQNGKKAEPKKPIRKKVEVLKEEVERKLPENGSRRVGSRENVVVESEREVVSLKDETEAESIARFSEIGSRSVGSRKNVVVESEREVVGMKDEIEAENLARLSAMSKDEIEEARAEIMEKMHPGMLELLRKRARGKKEEGGKKDEGEKRLKMGDRGGDWTKVGEGKNGLWRDWSERVEKVRELRFGLDGSVVGVGSYGQDKLDGIKLESHQYNVQNVAERDFLRTEGDPAAVGYTIKEAVALIRSMVPGQRALALQLLASIFSKALYNIQWNDGHPNGNINATDRLIDWQAVWAFALGPEPQLALSLRMGLDDNHDSVVLACAKAIQCILSCELNESFFNITEKVLTLEKCICTAPIFRSKPEIDGGYLRGGFWKYNTKPSNVLPSNDDKTEDENGEHTIQDDIVVAGQDVAAGFVRMGILPRICYLLEMDPLPTLEECLLSVLIALARHSPTSVNAILRCPRLVENVIKIFTRLGTSEISSQIKATMLLKVLSQSDKQICSDFVKHGIFQKAMWQMYRSATTLEHWIENGKDHCKLTSNLMVEQLRLWRVCVSYGYCISYFPDFYPSLCLWLNVPAFDKLIENDLLVEFTSITSEAYLVLEALSQRLPILHSVEQLNNQGMDTSNDFVETWSWSHVVPMVAIAVNWLSLKNIPIASLGSSASCMIWTISAILHMLCTIFDRIAPVDTDMSHNSSSCLPWLPEFVPKVGLEIVRNGFLNGGGSLVDSLCNWRQKNDLDASLSSVTCLNGLVRLSSSIDRSIQSAKKVCDTQQFELRSETEAEKILEEGLIKWAKNDLTTVLTTFVNLILEEWQLMQSSEMFGRGGPAPGIGFGWGSSNGGFWSPNVLLAQIDAELILQLFAVFPLVLAKDHAFVEGRESDDNMTSTRINSLLAVCLIVGPKDKQTLEKALDMLLQAPVLKYLNLCMNSRFTSFETQYSESNYTYFGEILGSYFRNRWISIKKKKSAGKVDTSTSSTLETINEDQEMSELTSKYPACSSLTIEWARQRLPLPAHWFLSAICSIGDPKIITTSDVCDVSKSGLFLLLGLESMSCFLGSHSEYSPVSRVSLVWKLHALSMALHGTMDVLDDEKSKNIYKILQELYGQHLDQLRCSKGTRSLELLDFQTEIHENYTTFVENLVEQFGAISYGDVIFGRQVALYLHQSVEKPVRLTVWKALSNGQLLELLPPLDKCIAEPEGYLMPAEEDEGLLEAYVKSWTSGALDRASSRESISFSLALHHVSSFIFSPNIPSDKSSLQSKLARSLLRSYSQKQHQEGMLLNFIRYKLPVSQEPPLMSETARRLELLKKACEGNSSLVSIVEKLKSAV